MKLLLRGPLVVNAVVCSRVRGLQEALSTGTNAPEISSRKRASRPFKSAGTGCARGT